MVRVFGPCGNAWHVDYLRVNHVSSHLKKRLKCKLVDELACWNRQQMGKRSSSCTRRDSVWGTGGISPLFRNVGTGWR